jgi:hypothetical protein
MEHVREGRPGLGHDLRVEAVTGTGPVDIPLDEPGVPKLPEMLGDRRLGEGKKIDETTADAAPAGGKDFEDADSDGMAQGLGQARRPDQGRVKCFGLRSGHGRSLS